MSYQARHKLSRDQDGFTDMYQAAMSLMEEVCDLWLLQNRPPETGEKDLVTKALRCRHRRAPGEGGGVTSQGESDISPGGDNILTGDGGGVTSIGEGGAEVTKGLLARETPSARKAAK